jgi:hypothetical protein
VLVCGQRSGGPVPSGLDWLVVGLFLFTAQLAKGNWEVVGDCGCIWDWILREWLVVRSIDFTTPS